MILAVHGSENWTVTARNKTRITATEMMLMRRIGKYTQMDYKEQETHIGKITKHRE
jgi:hypothetical protein